MDLIRTPISTDILKMNKDLCLAFLLEFFTT